MRRAVTLVEVMVSAVVGVIAMYVAWNALIMLGKSEKSVDREAARAIMEARVTEQLLQDLRSAAEPVAATGAETFEIVRWMPVNGAIERKKVTWTMRAVAPPAGPCLARQVEGEAAREFWFTGLLKPDDPRFRFRIEEVPDALFTP